MQPSERFHLMRRLIAKPSLYAVSLFHLMRRRSPQVIESHCGNFHLICKPTSSSREASLLQFFVFEVDVIHGNFELNERVLHRRKGLRPQTQPDFREAESRHLHGRKVEGESYLSGLAHKL